ncbi:hypothetical protein [Crocinitomix catalasitica]|uniref:hypothetical protein n=1 Tax=Crocinitomix catalasitica TaxID=184607 RepID=UPI000488C7FB|nr:hypothetical protein [Crocinitomix catalasitica]
MHPLEFRNRWRIRSHINGVMLRNISQVYRYMDQYWIDEFFKTGNLQLTSFVKNRTVDDIRNDENEGYHDYIILSRDRTKQSSIRFDDRDTHRMLCTSTELDLNKYLPYFKVDGCFKINNPLGFGYEVAKVLKGFEKGQEGMTEYTDRGFSFFPLEKFPDLPDLTDNSPPIHELFPYLDMIPRVDFNMFYLKKTKYSPENEYRLIWKCEREHDLIINCPDARKFCEKIT